MSADAQLPATPPHRAAAQPKFVCHDLWSEKQCARLTPARCNSKQRKFCAQACRTCTPLVVPVNVGFLVDGELPIPEDSSPLLLEIGASDRNTMDVEVLPYPGFENAFLVTAEPLVDKYARGLTRSRRADKSEDRAEPLGQQHERGFILPIAVSPIAGAAGAQELQLTAGNVDRRANHGARHGGVAANATSSGKGELKAFNVGGNAGCASLATLASKTGKNAASFGSWCSKKGLSQRFVWTVPLAQILGWIGRERIVDFVKIDAQGMDLQVVRSGGALLRTNVRRLGLEVVADDCNVLYEAQPRCSEVTATLAALGFEPYTPVPCTPPINRGRPNHYCELEILFVNTALRQSEGAAFDANANATKVYTDHHKAHLNWCVGVYHPDEFKRLVGRLRTGLADAPPDGRDANATVLAATAYGKMNVEYFSEASPYGSTSSLGRPYLCPQACFLLGSKGLAYHSTGANATHMLGYSWPTVMLKQNKHMRCPWW